MKVNDPKRIPRALSVALTLVIVLSASQVHDVSAGVAGKVATEHIMIGDILPENDPISGFAAYVNDHYKFTAAIPDTWRLDEHYDIDAVYGYVIRYPITGPPDSASSVGFTVLEFRLTPTAAIGGTIPDLPSFAAVTKVQKNRISGSVVSDVATAYQGFPAREIQIEFDEFRPPWDVGINDPQVMVTVRKRYLIFEREHHFWEISLESTTADWAQYETAYTTAKTSLIFVP